MTRRSLFQKLAAAFVGSVLAKMPLAGFRPEPKPEFVFHGLPITAVKGLNNIDFGISYVSLRDGRWSEMQTWERKDNHEPHADG